MGMSLRTTVVNTRQLLVRCILGSIPIPISNDDALGIFVLLAVLVTSADGLVVFNGILPIGSPNLIRTDCLAIVANGIRITACFDLTNCFQEFGVASRLGTACR